ncbi:reverse transcriptase domain-containing protein [Tanacetum coccineum]
MAPSRRSGNNDNNNNENPDIAAIIAQQLQTILPKIVTQVTNNVNNANNGNGGNGGGGNGNGENNRCTFKAFQSCNPKEYDGKGGVIALTRWIEKMENVIDNSGCAENQKVRYAASSLVNKALTWWNTQVQARGRMAAMAMTWNDFKALMVEEFCPSNEMEKLENEFWNHKMVGANHAAYTDRFHELTKLVPHLVTPESSRIKRYIAGLAPEIRGMLLATQPTTIQNAILRAGILTDEAVSYGTLTKGSDKRKGVEESGKTGGSWKDNKKAKTGTGFVATTPTRNEAVSSNPKCSKCFTHHPVNRFYRLCFNCQKPGHFIKDCRAPIRQAIPVNAVREVARVTARIALEFAPEFVYVYRLDFVEFMHFSVSLLLTPLCCDDIHDVTPRVSALAGMSPPIRRKYHDSVAFATGCKKIKKCRRGNRKIRIPIAMWPCRVEEKMTLKEVDGQTVEEIETKIIAKDGTITRVPGKFQGYETSEEEPFAPSSASAAKGSNMKWMVDRKMRMKLVRDEVDSGP